MARPGGVCWNVCADLVGSCGGVRRDTRHRDGWRKIAFSQVTRGWCKEPIDAPGQPPGHIIRAAMIDKAHLIDKHILFRLQTIPNAIYGGIVRGVEADGFWIEAPALTGEMRRDAAWGHVVEQFQDPSVLFVPTTSLMLLIAAKE